jgi:hypothetical protein
MPVWYKSLECKFLETECLVCERKIRDNPLARASHRKGKEHQANLAKKTDTEWVDV